MRIGAQTNPANPLDAELRQVAADGFDYAEIVLAAPHAALESTNWSTIAAQLEQLALPALCQMPVYLPIANPSPLVRQAALDEMRRAVDAAARLAASLISIPWTGWPPALSEREGYIFAQQWLSILVRHGAQQNVQVSLINSPDNRHQLKTFREVFHRTADLAFSYDIGNSNVGFPQSLTRDYLFALADRLRVVYLSDNDGTAPQYLPFGAPMRGGIDLAHELRTLRTFRYDGDLTVQVLGDRGWLHAARKQVEETWAQVS